jgi:hypothetical protein
MNPMKKRTEHSVSGVVTSMYGRLFFIFILLGFIILSLQVEAAQFEGTNIILPKEPISVSEKKPDQIVPNQQNTTNLTQAPSMKLANLNVEVASDVYSDKDRQVLYCPKGNYIVVRNRIFLTGSDLDKVKEVKYLLHPSFSNPMAVSRDPTSNFEVWIWSWGGFPVKATITTKSGQVFEKNFDFSFKSKFEEAQKKGIPQVMKCKE